MNRHKLVHTIRNNLHAHNLHKQILTRVTFKESQLGPILAPQTPDLTPNLALSHSSTLFLGNSGTHHQNEKSSRTNPFYSSKPEWEPTNKPDTEALREQNE